MLSIEDVYGLFEEIGCCSFSTLDGKGGVDARIAHFFAYDDAGLYLRTMSGKPFHRQMVEGGHLAVCGEKTEGPCVWDEDNMPHFQPGYMVRVSGQVRELSPEEVADHAARDPRFAVAVYDTNKYPETVVLVLERAWGELYRYDFNLVHMDYKILRKRFSWGGATFEEPGFRITDACIGCGACAQACTHRAIVEGSPYRIRGAWCDECGNCHNVCPVGAVVEK